eukprot:5443951-Ditylum_brightwellii.AAC.1
MVSIKRRRHRHIGLNESIDGCVAQDAAAVLKDIDDDCSIQNEDDCDDGISYLGDGDDDIVVDLSHFSGALCISKIRDVTADKENFVLEEVDAVNNDPSPSDLMINRSVTRSHNGDKNLAGVLPSKEYKPSVTSIVEDDVDIAQET